MHPHGQPNSCQAIYRDSGDKPSTLLHHQADLAALSHELAGTIPEPATLDHAALL